MFLIIKLIFISAGFFVLVTILAGISLVVRIRESLQNAFIRPGNTPTPPAGKGDIIEGEFKVIDEREK